MCMAATVVTVGTPGRAAAMAGTAAQVATAAMVATAGRAVWVVRHRALVSPAMAALVETVAPVAPVARAAQAGTVAMVVSPAMVVSAETVANHANRHARTIVAASCTAALTCGTLVAAAAPASAAEQSVTVMSRNIYLGADVSVALELIPDLPAAAQFMWEQVAATNFNERAPLLANELTSLKPDVVAIQEATQWICRSSLFGESTVVFDFTEQLLEQTREQGVPYVIASHDGQRALNPGYAIPAIPRLTQVTDPKTFQPLFGSDTASCGFTIGDALLVRAEIADQVTQVGTGDYEAKYAVVPIILEIARGYAWADIRFGDTTTRFVTTHLESVWDPETTPIGAAQADELVALMESWQMPLVVTGDFNMDPRDPRPLDAPNPGGQPDASTGCAPQPSVNLPQDAIADCNAYWKMIEAGFVDAGPNSLDPENATWGASALLAGPDLDRLNSGVGDAYGYTDRLDYVFVRNGVNVRNVQFVGEAWPNSDELWECTDPAQRSNAEQAAGILGSTLGAALCLPTDHVGIVASLQLPTGTTADLPPTAQPSATPLGWIVAISVLAFVALLVAVMIVRRRRR